MNERCRVLIADDTADIRLLLRLTLEHDGRFDVVGEAADGVEAVRLAFEADPDAIILDLAMPILDGLGAIREIIGQRPDAKILVLSSFDAERCSHKALELGASAYFEKSTDLERVADALAELCAA
ncbi:MAG: response regulator [Gaiellaceae bacterium]